MAAMEVERHMKHTSGVLPLNSRGGVMPVEGEILSLGYTQRYNTEHSLRLASRIRKSVRTIGSK
jgi:hypothetical protein